MALYQNPHPARRKGGAIRRKLPPKGEPEWSETRVEFSRTTRRLIEKAADVMGLSIREWTRFAVYYAMLDTLRLSRGTPWRVRPGTVMWIQSASGKFEVDHEATGDERVWVVDRIKVPPGVALEEAGWIVDWCLNGKGGGGQNFIVPHGALAPIASYELQAPPRRGRPTVRSDATLGGQPCAGSPSPCSPSSPPSSSPGASPPSAPPPTTPAPTGP